jgi:hypothetical protein
MDEFDLIGTHILLIQSSLNNESQPVGYLRVVNQKICDSYKKEVPLKRLLSDSENHRIAYESFESESNQITHMGYLCFDPAFKSLLEGIKPIDLLVWLGFLSQKTELSSLSFCGSANAKFRQGPWLEQIGEKIQNVPLFIHPQVPEPHEIYLIPRLGSEYVLEKSKQFQGFEERIRWVTQAGAKEVA